MLGSRCLTGVALAITMIAAPAPTQQPAPAFDVEPGIAALVTAVQSPQGVTRMQAATIMLALLAHGSTLRSGPHRAHVRTLVVHLRDDAAPMHEAPLQEHVLVTFALASVTASSNYRLLGPDVVRCVESLCTRLADDKSPPPSAEDQVLLRMLLWYLPSIPAVEGAVIRRCEDAAKCARMSFRLRDQRSAAAQLLVRRLDGEDAEIAELLAAVWPKGVARDPMHTWFGVYAATLAPRERRDELLKSLGGVVTARAAAGADDPGTWAPAPGFDRITTTALHTMVLATANDFLARTKK